MPSSPVTLLFEDDSGAVVTLQFDVTTQETHELVTTITEHPVETGADVADHVREELDRFTVEGYVNDSPVNESPGALEKGEIRSVELQIPEKPQLLGVSALLSAGISAIGGALFGGPPPVRVSMLTFEDFESRKRAAFEILDAARRAHKLCRIVTAMREYDDMLIEQLTVTRSPEDGTGATFTISLKELKTVDSDVTVAPQPAETLGQAKKAAGSKNAKKDKDLVDGKKRSLAKTLVNKGKDFLDTKPGSLADALNPF